MRPAPRRGPGRTAGPRLSGLLELLPDAAIVGREGRIVDANRAMARLMGAARPEDLVGLAAADMLDASSIPAVEEHVREGREKGEMSPHEITLVGIDGVERQVEVHGAVMREDGGESVLVVLRDVTARRRAERELRVALQRYETLLELSPVAVFTNRANRIEHVNAALLRLLGARHEEEVVGRPPLDFFHPGDHAAIRKRIRAALSGKPIPVATFRVVRLDGAVREIEGISSLIQDDRGKALQVVLRDVTEAQLTLQALRQSESRYRALAWQAPLGVIELDLQGTTRFVNPALERITGRGRDELLAMPFRDVIHPEDVESLPDATAWDHDREPERVYDYRVRRPDGTTRRVRGHGVPLRGSDGQPYGYMGIILDETDFLASHR